MPTPSVTARFDGNHIVLDEPLDLQIGQRLLVTILNETHEQDDFYRLAMKGLASCYGTAEPDYTEADIQK